MADIIQQIFSTIDGGFIAPLGNGMVGLIPTAWALALGIGLLALVFNIPASGGRGVKAGVLAALLVFGIVWFTYGDDIMGRITSGDVTSTVASDVVQGGSAPASGGDSGQSSGDAALAALGGK